MIKNFTSLSLLLLLLTFGSKAWSQVNLYTFSQSTGTYVPITGGTVIVSAADPVPTGNDSAAMDDYVYSGFTMPFAFNYAGAAQTSLNFCSNGWISFGTKPSSTSSPLSSTSAGSVGVISPLSLDLMGLSSTIGTTTSGSNVITAVGNTAYCKIGAVINGSGIPAGSTITAFTANTITISANATGNNTGTFLSFTTGEIRVETVGVAPNRTCIIQFTGMSRYSTGTTSAGLNSNINFQIHLAEGGGIASNQTVTIVYGNCVHPGTSTTVQAGIRGGATSDYNNRTTTTDWSATAKGTSNSATCTWSSTVFPVSGLAFTFAPPQPCATPNGPIAPLTLTPSAGTVSGTFTPSSPAADNYLVVRTQGAALNTTPVDGTTYTVGNTLGNGTVVAASSLTSFSDATVISSTNYTYTIFAYNSSCIGTPPLYNTANPLINSTTTLAAQAYVWNPTTGTADGTVASNWTPARTLPDISDTLYFTAGGSSTLTNMPSNTVAKIGVGNNTTIIINSATGGATASITKELDIAAGSTLELGGANAITLNFVSGGSPTASIAGNLKLTGTGTCTYNAANSVSTVTGTVDMNGASATVSGAVATLFFNAGSVCNITRNGGSVPTATWDAAATANITGVTTTITGISGDVGTIIYNCPSQTSANLSWGSSIDSIRGNLHFISSGTGSTRIGAGSGAVTTVVGDFTQDGGELQVTGSSNILRVAGNSYLNGGTLNMNASTTASGIFNAMGDVIQAAGHTISRSSTGAAAMQFTGSSNQNITIGGNVTATMSYVLNNPAGATLTGTLPVNTGTSNTVTSGAWSGTGGFAYTGTTTLIYNGTTPQTTAEFEFPAAGGPSALTVNNAMGVTLHAPRTITSGFTLTNGMLNTTSTNLLTLSTGITTPPSGSASSYVNGPLAIQVNSASNVTRNFAVGDAGGHKIVTLANFHTGGVLQTLTAEVISGNSNGTSAGLNLNPTRYFRVTNLGSIQSTSTPTIALGFGGDDVLGATATAVVTQGTTANGVYANIGQGAASPTTLTSSTTTPLTAVGGEYFVLANSAPLPKSWDGGASTNNWADAANWMPDGVPTCTDDVVLSGTGLSINLSSNAEAQNLTVNNGVTLNSVAGNQLTVGCATPTGGNKLLTFNSGAILNLSGGTIHINGGINFASGSTFNQTGGLLEIDPNDGTQAGSLAGVSAYFTGTNNLNCSGGTIRIIDPLHISNTNYAVSSSVSTTANTYYTGTHTIELGDGVSTTPGGGNGFRVYSFQGAGYCPYNNITVNGGSTPGRWTLASTFATIGTLTINSGSSFRQTGSFYMGGNIVNNGLYSTNSTLSLTPASSAYTITNAQSIGGTGTFRNTIPTTSSISAAGSGYAVGDVITLTGGTFVTPATFMVTTVNGTGGITAAVVADMGSYSVVPTNPVSVTGGTGTGATLNLQTSLTSTGYLIPSANFAGITINNTGTTGATFTNDVSYSGTLTFTKGKINMGSNKMIQIAGAGISGGSQATGWVTGRFQKNAQPGGISHTYPIGDANFYTPVVISGASGAVLTAGDIIASTTTGDHPDIANSGIALTKSINRYYTLETENGITFAPGSLTTTFNWDASDADAGITPANLIGANYVATVWSPVTTASQAATSLQVTGMGSLAGDFQFGEVFNPLAIKLVDIAAFNAGSRNRVDWTSASEDKGDTYILERSADGRSFTAIATMDAKGSASEYTYWDEQPLNGVNYYRLKMQSVAEEATYSKVVTAYVKNGGSFIVEAYPNPVSDKLNIAVRGQQDGNGALIVKDLTGKTVRAITVVNGVASIDMQGLAQGMYFVRYTDNSHDITIKVNKQ